MKLYKLLLLFLFLILSLSAVNAHGVDVTDNHMVIADDSNGASAKALADSNNINITVYKFTSADEVEHILLHAVNNSDKRIVVIAYTDEVRDFINQHPEVSSRIFISSNDSDDLKNAMMLATVDNSNDGGDVGLNDFLLSVSVSLIVGVLVGLAGGLFLAKRKLS